MAIKRIFVSVFILQLRSKYISSLVGFTVCLGVLAVAFEFLQDWRSTLMIIPISDVAKAIIAQVVYTGAMIGAIYFLIRFILGFFTKREDKPSPELEAIKSLKNNLSSKLDRLIEIPERVHGTTNGDEQSN